MKSRLEGNKEKRRRRRRDGMRTRFSVAERSRRRTHSESDCHCFALLCFALLLTSFRMVSILSNTFCFFLFFLLNIFFLSIGNYLVI